MYCTKYNKDLIFSQPLDGAVLATNMHTNKRYQRITKCVGVRRRRTLVFYFSRLAVGADVKTVVRILHKYNFIIINLR